MFYCKPVHIEQFTDIQEEISKTISKEILNFPRLYYPKNNREMFLGIGALKTSLEKLGLLDHLNDAGFGLHVLMPNSSCSIHVDTGTFPYSLNIPITCCKDSILYFYKLKNYLDDIEKYRIRTPYGTYYKFKEDDVDVVESYKLSTPFIMNTKIIHSVTNLSNNPRIMLLVRLNSSAKNII